MGTDQQRTTGFWASFGPGLLWAATAIGVSHLVQSTRAGALAGLGLAGVVAVALLLKYPFFEFGTRYSAATGESLIEGYARIGRWALWLYFAITLGTAVIVQSVIVLFTSYLLRYALGLDASLPAVAAVMMGLCGLLLGVGRYRALDLAIKLLIAILTVSTFAAAAVVLPRVDPATIVMSPTELGSAGVTMAFVLALMGWMPSALDIAAWSSLWTLAKAGPGNRPSVRLARLDFNIGYIGSSILAFAFIVLGAGVMRGSEVGFSPQGTVFATQLVELYTRTLGEWTRPFVLLAVVTTMASTALTVMDGFPRVIERTIQNLRADLEVPRGAGNAGRLYWFSFAALLVLTEIVLIGFIGNLTTMIDFATIVSFLTAPIVGWLTLRAVTSPAMPAEHRPAPGLLVLAYVGLVLLGGTGVLWVVVLLRQSG